MFYGCASLSSLPDISKWNTINVTNMSCMFNNCVSLVDIPNLQKLDFHNVKCYDFIFDGCSSLSSIPDILNFKIIKNKKHNCFSLLN